MSIKDDVSFVKKELGSDEKLLESAFKLETLYRKYKLLIWGVVIALVIFFIARAVLESMHEAKLVKANEAFIALQVKSDDASALKILKENNPALFDLFSYAEAAKHEDVKTLEGLASSKNAVIADASAYTASVLQKKPIESALYKELSLFQQAYLAIGAGDIAMAREKLEGIDERSHLAVITGFLKHSLIKAK